MHKNTFPFPDYVPRLNECQRQDQNAWGVCFYLEELKSALDAAGDPPCEPHGPRTCPLIQTMIQITKPLRKSHCVEHLRLTGR